MKVTILCLALMTVLLEVGANAPSSKGLSCYSCALPNLCEKLTEEKCKDTHNMCLKIYRPVTGGDGILVWGRGCTNSEGCEKEKKNKLVKVECCEGNLCNK
ncbi:hypothetical protein GDO86_017656 [Hymenochirus boettgeri]|uniref:UPAR/Ly6 domain-containing protein n=1 Tax=Hymenochirus boettgeri TaxID=247094 RepID=A0A8T2IPD6_9PIPI|nr:hypothetical protein GDO86_017656 [Hymenochirus boettgeri]